MTNFLRKAIVWIGLACVMPMAQAHVEPGAFLNRPANTTEQLVQQARNDKQVMQRYMRHFRMSREEVIEMLASLHPAKLEAAGSYVVYNCHEDEVIRARVFNLKKGTLLFCDSSGRPILKRSCGNPMIVPNPSVPLTAQPGPEQPPIPIPPVGPTPTEVAMPPLAPEMPCPPEEMAPIPPLPPCPVPGEVRGGNSNSFFFLPILLIFNNHSSKCCDCRQPVPEPASMAVMGLGASMVMLRRRKKAAKA